MTDPIYPPQDVESRRTDPQSIRKRVEALEALLERMFVVPGINQPIGLDAILSFIPGVGSVSAAASPRRRISPWLSSTS